MANGYSLELIQVKSVRLHVIADGVEQVMTLSGVFLSPQLACNTISLGTIKKKGFELSYNGGT